VASSGRNRKARVKPTFYHGLVHAYSWGSGLPSYHVFIMVDDVGVEMALGANIPAMSTLGIRSLGFGATRRVVPARGLHTQA
jgi:hypothetical protein